jgi:hypothetical protein
MAYGMAKASVSIVLVLVGGPTAAELLKIESERPADAEEQSALKMHNDIPTTALLIFRALDCR